MWFFITIEHGKYKGAIDEKTAKKDYQSKEVSETISVLENNDFSWISNLGYVLYSTGKKLKTSLLFAVKIVLEENLKDSENIIWPSLKHDNEIPVIDCYYLPPAVHLDVSHAKAYSFPYKYHRNRSASCLGERFWTSFILAWKNTEWFIVLTSSKFEPLRC